jgi:prohibitin 1
MKSVIGLFSNSKYMVTGVVCATGLYVANRSVVTVPPNYVGHTNLFGNVSDTKILSGLHFINPLSKLILIPLLTNKITSNVELSSKEGLGLSVQIDLNYNLDHNKTRDIYLEFRHDYEDILMKPMVNALVRDIVSGYEAKALYSEKTREEIRKRVNDELISKLGQRGFTVTQMLLSRIELPQQLKCAIENKLKTEQENDAFQFKIEQEKKEAERKRIEAQGIRDFQDIVSKGLTADALKWKSIEATLALAKSPNAKVVVIGNSGTNGLPLILGDTK